MIKVVGGVKEVKNYLHKMFNIQELKIKYYKVQVNNHQKNNQAKNKNNLEPNKFKGKEHQIKCLENLFKVDQDIDRQI